MTSPGNVNHNANENLYLLTEFSINEDVIEKKAYPKEVASLIKRRIRLIVNSKPYTLITISLTVLSIVLSTIAKTILFNETLTSSGYEMGPLTENALLTVRLMIIVCLLISAFFCFEIVIRMIVNGKHFFWRENKGFRQRNVSEALIIFGELILSIIALSQFSSNPRNRLSTLFGSLITLRLVIFILSAPPLHSLFRAVKRASRTIVCIVVFCACLLYACSVLSHLLFSPWMNAHCTICVERFGNIESTFFSMLQVVSCDTWVGKYILFGVNIK
jgi:hypothetical protein